MACFMPSICGLKKKPQRKMLEFVKNHLELVCGAAIGLYILVLEIRITMLEQQVKDAKLEALKSQVHSDIHDMSDDQLHRYIDNRARKDS